MRVGILIRQRRNDLRLSAKQLAERAGVVANTVLRLESGGPCKFNTVVRIAASLDLDMAELAAVELKNPQNRPHLYTGSRRPIKKDAAATNKNGV